MKEASLLIAVQGVVGGIEIEDDLLRRFVVGLQEQRDKQALQGLRVVADPVVAPRCSLRRVLKAIERRLAGKSCAVLSLGLKPVRQQAQHRVVAQLVMVFDILITKRDPGNALADHRLEAVDHQILIAMIDKTGRNPLKQIDGLIDMAQQQRTGIRRYDAAIKSGNHPAAIKVFKLE